jgi:hypothetical protein
MRREVAIMADMQGPKIRVGKFENGKIELNKGDHSSSTPSGARTANWATRTAWASTTRRCRATCAGDILLLNDGLIVLVVDKIIGDEIYTTVKIGGELSNNKGINRQGGGLTAPALTAKDMEDIKTAMSFQADYLAISFPKNATDMEMARQLANIAGEPYNHKPMMIAKIERAEAIPAAAGNPRRLRRHHGRARRPGGRSRQRRRAGAAKAHDQDGARVEQARHHRHPDDGVDDRQRGADARRSVGRRQRGAGRHRRRDDLGRDRLRQVPGRDRRDDGRDLRRGRKIRSNKLDADFLNVASPASTSRSPTARCSPRTTCA